jgi:hypothetical protein
LSIKYNLVGSEDGSVITVYLRGHGALTAHSSHPNFGRILEAVLEGTDDDNLAGLFDAAKLAESKFNSLSERVSVANGRLYLDGDEVNNALTTQVLRFIDEGVEDWKPLVKFFENVQANPNEHSREQLFNWLDRRDFTITTDGLIVGYKGVRSDLTSVKTGKATVNGEVKTGNIPNPLGAVIEMPRSDVHHAPGVGCSTGLHVGTYDYAKSFTQGKLLEVHVNPRDVVSVPTDSAEAKMRVCRYVVVDEFDHENPYATAYVESSHDPEYWGDGEDDDLCECGEYPENCDCYDNDIPVLTSADITSNPAEFVKRSGLSVDNAWRAWNTDTTRTPMTRDEFRAAAK